MNSVTSIVTCFRMKKFITEEEGPPLLPLPIISNCCVAFLPVAFPEIAYAKLRASGPLGRNRS